MHTLLSNMKQRWGYKTKPKQGQRLWEETWSMDPPRQGTWTKSSMGIQLQELSYSIFFPIDSKSRIYLPKCQSLHYLEKPNLFLKLMKNSASKTKSQMNSKEKSFFFHRGKISRNKKVMLKMLLYRTHS